MRIFTNRSIKTLFLRIFLGLVVFTCLSIVSVAWKFKNVSWCVLLLSCCHYQGARFGGRSLFDRSIDGHSRNLSHYDRRVRAALPHPAKTQALLLQARSFCVGVLYGLPHEAQRCGTGVYLYPRHDGACDDLFYVGTVHRRRRCDPHPLPQGDKRLVPNG